MRKNINELLEKNITVLYELRDSGSGFKEWLFISSSDRGDEKKDSHVM